MKRIWMIICSCLFLWMPSVWADEVDYSIPNYEGNLVIHEDNSADFVETVTYHFDSDYKGQILTLGKAGKLPKGFSIEENPEVTAKVNNRSADIRTEVSDLGDGYQAKIYNSGRDGDKVVVRVHWKLKQILQAYQDIAELNWIPISDWDETLRKVDFTVTTDKSFSKSKLWVHRGYFSPTTNISLSGNSYRFSSQNVSGQLEIHAYWDKGILSSNLLSSKTGLKQVLAVEEGIRLGQEKRNQFYKVLLPSVGAVLLVLGGITHLRFRRWVNPFGKDSKHLHLYEYPQDLAPLVLAEAVYDLNLSYPGRSSLADQSISFERMIQASLLDLIDRKALALEEVSGKVYLKRQDAVAVSAFEDDLISMALGRDGSCALDNLFEDYQFDDNRVKTLKKQYSGSELENHLNQLGDSFTSRYERQLEKIDRSVDREIKTLGLESLYREVSRKEHSMAWVSGVSFILVVLLCLFAGGYMAMKGQAIFNLYLFEFVLALVGAVLAFQFSKPYLDHGVLTAEGQLTAKAWVGFVNMLRDINSFDRVDLEGVVVWNRILVYATLFGYAKQVEQYLTVHQISLPQDFDLAYHQTAAIIGVRSGLMTQSFTSATSASHFSVSTSGSSGGGFSGGGGGGGGGAF